jgi:hypothetical protein
MTEKVHSGFTKGELIALLQNNQATDDTVVLICETDPIDYDNIGCQINEVFHDIRSNPDPGDLGIIYISASVEQSPSKLRETLLNDDNVATKAGNRIINLLGLKVKRNGRVDTSVGDKTPMGLARTIARFLKPDDEDEKQCCEVCQNFDCTCSPE